ncbi:uncharacterized protein, partial [Palaemon carinicauda]|uniref:uncharacterized protein n=1 Tax=Palaemon carinicauda TaxID=392227 RepID=UPI0035B61F54
LVALKLEPDDWCNYLRMDEDTYIYLLNRVSPFITYEDTNMRKAITPHERLSVTLRYLATGRSLNDLKYSAIISTSSLSCIILDTCAAIYKVLHKDYLKFPTSVAKWQIIAREFESRWNFPNCVGAVDGKHVCITPPPDCGSYFWNYKGYNSLVLLGVVNVNYEFTMADIRTNGRVSDGRVIENTEFGKRLSNKRPNIPDDTTPVNSNCRLPYVFVGDEAFALRPNFMKPYPQKDLNAEDRIYNYRLSRARRVVENVFGIMASRFRVFYTSIHLKLSSIEKIVMACVILHNYLRITCPSEYSPAECFHRDDIPNGITVPGLSVDSITVASLAHGQGMRNYSKIAKDVRVKFKDFFDNEGAVP